MPISIHEVDTTNRRQVNAFLRLPFKLYADIPQWVPPLWRDARLQLDRQRHPFYRDNDAAFFLATHDGETVGRICAMLPRRDNAVRETDDASGGWFEALDMDSAHQPENGWTALTAVRHVKTAKTARALRLCLSRSPRSSVLLRQCFGGEPQERLP